jgi:hypothetical protein
MTTDEATEYECDRVSLVIRVVYVLVIRKQVLGVVQRILTVRASVTALLGGFLSSEDAGTQKARVFVCTSEYYREVTQGLIPR